MYFITTFNTNQSNTDLEKGAHIFLKSLLLKIEYGG